MKGPDSEKIKKLFDSIAGDYDRLNHLLSLGTDRCWRKRSLESFVDSTQAQEILDVACGTGDYSIDIASAAAPGTVVTGLDLSEGMLAEMRQKVARKGLEDKICIMQGNCEQMPFSDSSFDCVSIAFGIRNFEHREQALREIRRVLRPGDKAAYRYLPASVLKFHGRKEWMATMASCGYKNVAHKSFTLGICRMYTATK